MDGYQGVSMGFLLHHEDQKITVAAVAPFFWLESGLHETHARLKLLQLGMRSRLTLFVHFPLYFWKMPLWLHNVVLHEPQESAEDSLVGQACSLVLCPCF